MFTTSVSGLNLPEFGTVKAAQSCRVAVSLFCICHLRYAPVPEEEKSMSMAIKPKTSNTFMNYEHVSTGESFFSPFS